MKSFLRKVASYYKDINDIEDYCFVFPNRRSGQFFEKELAECFTSPRMMPSISTLTELLQELTPKVATDQIDAIFILYQAYSDVFADKASSMDSFIYWANIILNDFNDIDMALADPVKVYANVSDLRNISTDYIDNDLKKEIQRIFNIQFSENNSFWRHDVRNDNKESAENIYFTLWERLADIYNRYHELLNAKNLTTQGQLYRNAALNPSAMKWRYKRLVMVGFAGLTNSEDRIFKAIKEMDGHFWWDCCSKAFSSRGNSGINLVEYFNKRFPSPVHPEEEEIQRQPQVFTFSVPSAVGQAKWAMYMVKTIGQYSHIFSALSMLLDKADFQFPVINLNNAINSAIVIPDEKLFVPIVNSVPQEIKRMNVTMGYSMRNASIVSLMHLVARAQQQATLSHGHIMYFRDIVLDILSHPMVKSTFTSHVIKLQQAIESNNEFNVSEELFQDTPLEMIFTSVQNTNDKSGIIAYLDRLIAFTKIIDAHTRKSDNATLPEDADQNLLPLQSAFNMHYVDSLKQIRTVIENSSHLPSVDSSIYYLIDRATSNITIPFTGEPLEGLQVMGMLETRSLDFDNIIMLSMNERVFPSRRSISSFIPEMIRNAHSMPTNSFNDAATTYYFYRLLSHSKYAFLIYNSNTQSFGTSEASRYIGQLEKIYNIPVNKINIKTSITPATELDFEVKKSTEMVERYISDSENKKYLSASAINGFIDCPMRFYFQRIQGFSNDSNTSDFMDAATFGTIVHNSLQAFYYPEQIKDDNPRIITSQMIDDFKKNNLNKVVIREINKEYNHLPEEQIDRPLTGDAYILQESINTYVENALNYDKALIAEHGNITILECEKPHETDLDIMGTKFHFFFKIDRLDKVGNTLRVVDYKTGSDKTIFGNVEQLFNSQKGFERPHAILQLLLYCNAWRAIDEDADCIQPVIYKLSDMKSTGVKIGTEKNNKTYIYHPDDDVNKEFLQQIKASIDKLLSVDEPFKQTPYKENCTYCRFNDFCRRKIDKKI
ncbi:MAG: PD-(D/E)XK nuclease family protein [Muribaculaceae bacterium]|nr:PD-(D/E)XK nuclease family protein [Muribaculaceae bacterium]